MIKERVDIVMNLVNNVTGKTKEVITSMEQISRRTQRYTQQIYDVEKGQKRLISTQSKLIQGQQKFQMQWLSLLFAGMALNRTMNGLVKTSMEWVGITDLWSTTMGVVFLPVAEMLLELLLPIMDWFMNLSPEAQKAIGIFVVALGLLGGVLSAVGQIALGMSAISWLTASTGIAKIGTEAGIAAGAVGTASSGLLGALTKVAGIGLIGLGLVFAAKSITTDDTFAGIVTAIGSGIAIALGATLLGASASTGILIGGLVATILVAYKIQKASEKQAQKEAEKYGLSSTMEYFSAKGRSTAQFSVPSLDSTTMSEQYSKMIQNLNPETILPSTNGNMINLLSGFSLPDITKSSGGSSYQVPNIQTTYNVTVSDKREFEDLLKKNNESMTREVQRLVS